MICWHHGQCRRPDDGTDSAADAAGGTSSGWPPAIGSPFELGDFLDRQPAAAPRRAVGPRRGAGTGSRPARGGSGTTLTIAGRAGRCIRSARPRAAGRLRLIPKIAESARHLDVGRLLLADRGSDVPDDRLFQIAESPEYRRRPRQHDTERMPARAAESVRRRKAKMSTAYRSAALYFERASRCSPTDTGLGLRSLFGAHLRPPSASTSSAIRSRPGPTSDRSSPGRRLPSTARRCTPAHHAGREPVTLDRCDGARPRGARAVRHAVPEDPAEAQAVTRPRGRCDAGAAGGGSIASLVDLPVATDPAVRMMMRLLTICGRRRTSLATSWWRASSRPPWCGCRWRTATRRTPPTAT